VKADKKSRATTS